MSETHAKVSLMPEKVIKSLLDALEVTSNITLLGVTPPLCEKGLEGVFMGGEPRASRTSQGHPRDILWATPGMSQHVATHPGDIWP